MKPFLTPAETEAIKERIRLELKDLQYGKDGDLVLALVHWSLEHFTAKPGSHEFCVPRKCSLFLCNPDSGYFTPTCVHEDFDGVHFPLEKKEEKCL